MEWGTNMKGYYPTVPACLKCVSELRWLFSGFKLSRTPVIGCAIIIQQLFKG